MCQSVFEKLKLRNISNLGKSWLGVKRPRYIFWVFVVLGCLQIISTSVSQLLSSINFQVRFYVMHNNSYHLIEPFV